ncbi:NACHT domain-containing protein [Nonomuraea salmonea]|uniref:NACHT domain-containing protein n=1 Tax=Nonomuraea salmonea TaxID=46181 RepID=UPI002FEBFF20
MSEDRPLPPDPAQAGDAAEFVAALVRLRQWAGEPSLSRLRALGGQVAAADGALVDALPKSTTSHVLRQTDRLPRWEFVRAFVTACLRSCEHPEELIGGELERWRAARAALAGPAIPPHRPLPHRPLAQMLLPQKPLRRRPLRRWPPLRGLRPRPGGRPARTPGAARGGQGTQGAAGRLRHRTRLLRPEPGRPAHHRPVLHRPAPPQRLLVVGESGAGKTVLAIELVLQLLESPLATGRPPRTVPVRLNAARWTPGRPFESWLAEQLVQDFGLAAGDAHRLVRDRRVLPVVDGLDELDPGPPAGPPRRAMGLLAELNRYSDLSGRRAGAVVVTCRADRHAELRAAGVWLDNATVIRLHDLSVEQIAVYLKARWPDGHPCADHRDGIQAALSGPDGRAVHLALATPWRLLLTATAVESGADPYELLRVDPHADSRAGAEVIARRLLEAYVPAATRLTPRAAYGTAYQPEQVRAWLEHMAAHLRRQAGHSAGADRPPPGLTAIDLVPPTCCGRSAAGSWCGRCTACAR